MNLEEELGIDSETTPAGKYWEKVDNYLEKLFNSELKDDDNQLFTEKVCRVYFETDFDYEEHELNEEEYALLFNRTESQYYVHGRETNDCDWFLPTNAYVYILKYYFNTIRVRSGAGEKTPHQIFEFYEFDNYDLFEKEVIEWKQSKLQQFIQELIQKHVMENIEEIINLFDIKIIAKDFYEDYGHFTYEGLGQVKKSLSLPSQETIYPSLLTYLSEKVKSDFPGKLPQNLPNKLTKSRLVDKWRQSGSCIIKPEDAFSCGYSDYSDFLEELKKCVVDIESDSELLRECLKMGVNKSPSEDWTDLIDLYAFERSCEESFSEIEEEKEEDPENYVFLTEKTDSNVPSKILDFFDKNHALILENLNFNVDYGYEQFQDKYKNLTAAKIKALMMIECKTLADNGHMMSIEIPECLCTLLKESCEGIIGRIDQN